ncbi:helix-turn-helix domain-containing protein [Thiohalophilus sp.]|uniref:helix-turn-helix domain-containing protein n=1 Tax=Thiohalophilus sp. TaxID=3028392 RepID=UPI002ACE17BD|nr:helix-turn-helix domain-containing protein [Thiohalophilus sp.]MDZ7663392.1 helix-turn-helix domain-containing protein [Thiohalophilus sp.]
MEREALQQPEMPPAEPRMWPGKRLREAREARNLSREQVAHQLHQEVSTIVALEEDDYARLPGKTYVLGYLRSYARLLQLPESEIIAAVQIDHVETSDLLPEHIDYDKPVRLTPRSARPLLYIVLILLIVAGLVGLFFGMPSLPFGLG